jgi:GntR family transcriptional regulator / MocR family aminotransferase
MPKKQQPLLSPSRVSTARADLETHITLRRRSRLALHLQIVDQLRDAIRGGRLKSGSRIPSSRQLASTLNVDRNLVVLAFEILLSEGHLSARSGSGTFVTTETISEIHPILESQKVPRWAKREIITPQTDPAPQAHEIAFRLGQPSMTELDLIAWRKIWRDVNRHAPFGDYAEPAGHFGLRQALADYLHRARGLNCTAADIIITSGITQAAQLIARATLGKNDRIAFEEPGYGLIRQVFLELGARILPIQVDDDGLRVSQLSHGKSAPLLVYCTPSHQYPLGSRLSIPRRVTLLEWARTNGSLILEDDYDSEFRFETAPLPALAALGPDCTAYMGTFSKTLTPSLRVGFLVAPPGLHEPVLKLKTLSDYHTSIPVQQVLAQFILGGHFERHIRRMRRVYASKRETLVRALEPIQSFAPLKGLEAGLHAFLELPPEIPAQAVTDLARSKGVIVRTLESFHHKAPVTNGLLLGYGGLSLEQIQRGVQEILRAVTQYTQA